MSRYRVAVYNVGPIGKDGRGLPVLHKEVTGILSTGVEVLELVETIGWGDLWELPGYQRFRDRSTDGRANITAYVHESLEVTRHRWHPMHQTWRETRDGAGPHDQHPPREVLELVIGESEDQFMLAHQPPDTKWKDTGPAKEEQLDFLVARMAPWTKADWSGKPVQQRQQAKARLRTCLWDPNGDAAKLAARMRGVPYGTSIEGAVVRGGTAKNDRKQAQAGGVPLRSDHHGAFFATITG